MIRTSFATRHQGEKGLANFRKSKAQKEAKKKRELHWALKQATLPMKVSASLTYTSIALRIIRYTYPRKNLDNFLTFFEGKFDNYDRIASERGAGMIPADEGGHEHILEMIAELQIVIGI